MSQTASTLLCSDI
ncbi:FERM RhoGEF and pleckstrin domain protein 2, partial [Danaus plexippus plexippus]